LDYVISKHNAEFLFRVFGSHAILNGARGEDSDKIGLISVLEVLLWGLGKNIAAN